MFDRLIVLYLKYKIVIQDELEKPIGQYLPDRVQAHGMAFATELRRRAPDLISAGFAPEKFGYGDKLDIMARLMEDYEARD